MGGNISGNNGIEVDDSTASGDIFADNGEVKVSESDISGNIHGYIGVILEEVGVEGIITAPHGKVDIEDSYVSGKVNSDCCTITVEDSYLSDGISGHHDSIKVKDSTINGDVSGNNSLEFEDVLMPSGSIEAQKITIKESQIGTQQSRVKISSNDGWNNVLTVEDVFIHGDIYAHDNSFVKVNGDSNIHGVCLPYSDPIDACTPSVTGSVLSWQMDEHTWQDETSVVIDASGNGLHGTAYNGVEPVGLSPALPTDNFGYGTCNYGEFNGQDQYVELQHDEKLSFSDNFTVSAWIKPTAYPTQTEQLKTIVSKDGNYEFHLNADKKIYWWWQQQGNKREYTLKSQSDIALNQWTHITIRYQKATGSDKTSQWIFINGVEDSFLDINHKVETNQLPFQVGQDQGISTRFFKGSIDEVRVFNSALSDNEIADLARERHPCDDITIDSNIRYGRVPAITYETEVVFEQAFPAGTKPLVFLSPSINAATPDQDGPSSLRLLEVSNTGFKVRQLEPSANQSYYTPSQLMADIDYVAALPGKITLSNGQEMYAGTFKLRAENTDKELQGSKNGNPTDPHRGWKSVLFPPDMFGQKPTLMLEIQSNNNSRWLTAAGNQVTKTRFKAALEQSEVRGGNANNPETVAYLAALPGHGTFELFGKTVGYDFQHARSGRKDGVQDFETRCNETTPFKYLDFISPPVMVVGKLSRSGNNGGWIRRCHRDSKVMSIVMDEDQDSDEERSHVPEDVSYMAFSIERDEAEPDFEFGPYPDSALTCTPVDFTVNVVDKDDGTPITDFTGQIGLKTSSGKGDWRLKTGAGSFVAGNKDSGNASYHYSEADKGSATFSLDYLHVGTINIILTSSSGEELKQTGDINYQAEGLVLERKYGFPYGRKTAIANKPLAYTLKAVTESTAVPGQCQPIESFAGEKKVRFSFDYVTDAGREVVPTVNKTALVKGASKDISMQFEDGMADMDFNYVEAGAIKLTVKQADDVVLPPDDPSKDWLAQEIINISPWLVISNTAGNKKGTASDSGKGFKPAGEPFLVTYKSVVWDSSVSDSNGWPVSDPSSLAVTQNFSGDFPANIVVGAFTPSNGTKGDLTFPNLLQYTSGASPKSVEAIYGEVGSLKLSGGAASNYLVSENTIPFYTHAQIGRFYPKYLELRM